MMKRRFLRGYGVGLGAAVFLFLALFLLPDFSARGAEETNEGRIKPWKENLRYWEYKGKPILLLGASDEDNLFNDPDLMWKNFEIMGKCGGNYIRGTLSCRDEGNVWPFLKKDGLYDLNKWNPEFWKRLETSLREAEKRDIIVQIEIWATFDFYRDLWKINPFNPVLNSNYTTENTKLVLEWNYHPARKAQPFFFSIPGKNNDRELLKLQNAFVWKVLEVSLAYPNVLYCLDNETRAPEEWAVYWGRFIKKEAEKRGIAAQVTEMWDIWDLRHDDHSRTYTHPKIFSYTDVSQNNWQVGQTHYDRLMWYRDMLVGQPGGVRPMNNVKVYMRQGGGKPGSAEINIDRWWQNVFAGCASTRFHRPTGGIGLNEQAQKVVRAARAFTSSFDIFHSSPRPDLLGSREENEAYCLAIPGKVYALYFPKGGEVRLKVPLRAGVYTARWFDPETAEFQQARNCTLDSTGIKLRSPDTKQTWLVLVE